MKTPNDLIPRPPLVRERLARNLREGRLLRRLLRVAEAAAEERQRQAASDHSQTATGREVDHA
jgi:hypothetical protein